jgi:hypothetical protein
MTGEKWRGSCGSGTLAGYEVHVRTDSEPTTVCGRLLTREWKTMYIRHGQPNSSVFGTVDGGKCLSVPVASHDLPMLIQCGLISIEVAEAYRALFIAAARAEPLQTGPDAPPWPRPEARIVRRQYKFSYEASEWPENAVTAEEAIEPAKKKAAAK